MIRETFNRVDNTPAIGTLMIVRTETGHYRITVNSVTLELDQYDFGLLISKMETMVTGAIPICSICYKDIVV